LQYTCCAGGILQNGGIFAVNSKWSRRTLIFFRYASVQFSRFRDKRNAVYRSGCRPPLMLARCNTSGCTENRTKSHLCGFARENALDDLDGAPNGKAPLPCYGYSVDDMRTISHYTIRNSIPRSLSRHIYEPISFSLWKSSDVKTILH
jgi:hypothetical protein